MKNCVLFLACLLQIAAVPALIAQDESPSHREAVKKLIELMAPREMFISAFMSGVEPLFEQLKKGGIEDAKIEQVRAASLELANKVADDPAMTERLSSVYMDEFTEEELNAILEFYKTPTGAKALSKLPLLFQKGAEIGKEITEKHQATFQAKIQEILGAGPGN